MHHGLQAELPFGATFASRCKLGRLFLISQQRYQLVR